MDDEEQMKTTLEICADCNLPKRDFPAGETIMVEAEKSDTLLVLVSGKVEVVKQKVELNRISSPGSVFGEIAVLLDSAHTADVKTVEGCTFYVVENARDFLRSNPDFNYHVSALLARRLESLSGYLVDVKKQYASHEDHLGMVDEVLESLLHQQPRNR